MHVTAGNWHVAEVVNDEIVVESDEGGIVALIPPWTDDAKGKAEQLANATAIAKVPQLIAFARRVAEAFDGTDSRLGKDANELIAEIEGR